MQGLEDLINRLDKLNGTEIQIVAEGEYPKGTPVQQVAYWQNNGTDRGIKPARFVEKAARSNLNWRRVVSVSFNRYLTGDDGALMYIGHRIATDIGKAVNRIKTGQLKTSMEAKVVE